MHFVHEYAVYGRLDEALKARFAFCRSQVRPMVSQEAIETVASNPAGQFVTDEVLVGDFGK